MATNMPIDNEKAAYTANEKDATYAPGQEGDKFANAEERRQSVAGVEATDLYGNVAEAEEFGYVERG
jgi:hypothetical protein